MVATPAAPPYRITSAMTHQLRKSRLGTIIIAIVALPLAIVPVPVAAAADGRPPPSGLWLTPDGGGVIGIEPCGEDAVLCGRIVGLTLDAPGSPMPTDVGGRPLCNLRILEMNPENGGTWRGRITNPRDGSVWRAEMWLGDDGSLRLRGYLGIPLFGRTQVWAPYTGRLLPRCRMG